MQERDTVMITVYLTSREWDFLERIKSFINESSDWNIYPSEQEDVQRGSLSGDDNDNFAKGTEAFFDDGHDQDLGEDLGGNTEAFIDDGHDGDAGEESGGKLHGVEEKVNNEHNSNGSKGSSDDEVSGCKNNNDSGHDGDSSGSDNNARDDDENAKQDDKGTGGEYHVDDEVLGVRENVDANPDDNIGDHDTNHDGVDNAEQVLDGNGGELDVKAL